MTAWLLLAHGDDGFGLDAAVTAFGVRAGAGARTEIVPERSPDEPAIDRARIEAGTVGMFGAHLVVLRQPLRAAGRSTSATDRLLSLVSDLPDAAALALVEVRPSRDAGRPPALLSRLAQAVAGRGGQVEERLAPRRGQLQAWIRQHAERAGTRIEPRAAAMLAERIGGAVAESDVERGEQTRIADGELRKLATFAGERPITAEDVEQLVADTRPASLFAITNAVDRRDGRAAASALELALAEGQPPLRIMGALQGRVADLIVAGDLAVQQLPQADLVRRVGRGNARVAERLVEAAGRYRPVELEAMLHGLFETDVAIKSNDMEPEPAIAAWVGEYLLGAEPRSRR